MPELQAGIMGWTGRGDYGHGLDLVFLDLPGVETVAVADPNATGRATAMDRCGALRSYASFQEMLARERLDLVCVAPRHADCHAEMILAAARHGAHIFCEKPLASTLEEADRLVQQCQESGVKLMVAHQNRAWPAPAKARQILAAGEIGRLRSLRAYGKLDHRAGGEDLMVLGTHLLDLMRFFAGDALWVDARVTQGERDAAPEDIRVGGDGVGPVAGNGIYAVYGFERGVVGTYESFIARSGGSSDYFRLELYGTAGSLAFRSGPIQELWQNDSSSPLPGRDGWKLVPVEPLVNTPRKTIEESSAPGLGAGGPLLGEMHPANQLLARELILATLEGREPESSGQDGRAALEMILAVYESHFTRSRVSLPLARREHPLARWRDQ